MFKPLLLAALFSGSALAAQPELLDLTIPNTTIAPVIDGQLNESVWNDAASVSLNIQTRPEENTAAPVATEAKLIATDDTLFVAFIANDPKPNQIRAHLSDRDKSWSDDLVGIKLDTWNQSRLAYQFFVNPLGVQHDSIENELTGKESDAWDGIWYAAGERTADGYQVELALPLRLFSFDSGPNAKQWGIELVRMYPRDNSYRLAATPVDRNQACRLCQMGLATGFSGAKPGRALQLTPSFTANRTEEREDGEGPWEKDNSVEPGFDLAWGITPDTKLNLTINPDFSQVEADSGQLDVNTTFALFFPEKRPFYLDGADAFETQLNLVHTRNLSEPEFGTKVTGQRGSHIFGLLQTRDEQTNFLLPGNLSSTIAELDGPSDNLAARYLYDSGEGWTVGTIATYRDSGSYHNGVIGVDGSWKFNDRHKIDAMALLSETEYPDDFADEFCDGDTCEEPENTTCDFGDCDFNEQVLRASKEGSFQGQLLRLAYRYDSRNWFGYGQVYDADEDFRADLGFLSQVDFTKAVVGMGRVWYPSDNFFHKIQLNGDVDRSENQAGEELEQEVEAHLSFFGRHQSYLELYGVVRDRAGQRNDDTSLSIEDNAPSFKEEIWGAYGELRPLGSLKFGGGVQIGDVIDFANNQLGDFNRLNGWVNWKPNQSLSTNLNHQWRTLDVPGGELFSAHLSDFRATWQLDLRNFIRFTAIYQDVKRTPELYRFDEVDRREQQLSAEILYGYKLNPQTVFYAGFGDGLLNNDSLSQLTEDNRTYFIKLSYAWLV